MSKDAIYPKVAVLCMNSEGSPELRTCTPAVTHTQMINGDHYDLAKASATAEGFREPMIAFDATDAAARQLAEASAWLRGPGTTQVSGQTDAQRNCAPAPVPAIAAESSPEWFKALASRMLDSSAAPVEASARQLAGRSEVHGNVQATVSATNHLFDAWRAAVNAGVEGNLIRDVDLLVEAMAGVRQHALEMLPVKNGGLGGRPKQQWLDDLAAIDVGVCRAEEVPGDGFWQVVGGWQITDFFGSEEEAISTAVRLNLERSAWDAEAVGAPTRERQRGR